MKYTICALISVIAFGSISSAKNQRLNLGPEIINEGTPRAFKNRHTLGAVQQNTKLLKNVTATKNKVIDLNSK